MNRIILNGSLPSPANPPKGCKFHTRCEFCMEICSYAPPEYAEIAPGHYCACHLYNDEQRQAKAEETMAHAKAEEKKNGKK